MNFLNFTRRYHRVFVLMFACSIMLLIAGCSGTFLANGEEVITIAEAALTSLLGVLAIIPGAAAVVPVITEALAALKALGAAIETYKTTPGETTAQKVTEAFTVAEAALNAIGQSVGLPASIVTKITAVVGVVLGQVLAWFALFQKATATTPAPTVTDAVALHAALPEAEKPLKPEPFRAKLNEAFAAPTGDAVTDQAFQGVKV